MIKMNKWLTLIVSTYLYLAFDYIFLLCHVRISEWIHVLYLPECQIIPCSKQAQCLRFKRLNVSRNTNSLVRKWSLKHLAKLTKWLSWIVSTYLYGAFDSMLLSSHVRVSEWIHIPYLPECQIIPYSKQAVYLKFKWLQQDPIPQPLNS